MDFSASSIADCLDGLDWAKVATSLDTHGFATTGRLLPPAECGALTALYDNPAHFRSRVVMRRRGFGEGEYQYFGYPLPPVVEALRRAAYRRLVPIAKAWRERLKLGEPFPDELGEFLDRCHAAGQSRPTPLLLKYGLGDYNRPHQDLYGELHFQVQMAFLLSAPHVDFDGVEFVLTEQQPRSQSRVEVVPLARGEAGDFFGQLPTEDRHAGRFPGDDAARGEPSETRRALLPGRDLPRREVTDAHVGRLESAAGG